MKGHIEKKFKTLLKDYSDAFSLHSCELRISEKTECNASVISFSGANLITVTRGYIEFLERTFNRDYFSLIPIVGMLNGKEVSDALCDLYEDPDFEISAFMLNCSIQFTFSHEFQHILQMNYDSILINKKFNESIEKNNFCAHSHALEFDSDRMAAFEVLKFVFSEHKTQKNKNHYVLQSMIFMGLASAVITFSLFFFRVESCLQPNSKVDKVPFYTKEYSHPHPLVRAYTIVEYLFECAKSDFPEFSWNPQVLFNNIFGTMKVYFDALFPEQSIVSEFMSEFKDNLDQIIEYNQELYDFAIKEKSIIELLKTEPVNNFWTLIEKNY